jgi:7-cyano-7-deazaguanine reductase
MGTLEKRQSTRPSKVLEAFENPKVGALYMVECSTREFTCLCPLTGQPDFARISLRYVPGPRCVELKSLKLYLWSYRDEGVFHEDVVNRMLTDLAETLDPIWMEVRGDFEVRGGIATSVSARHGILPPGLEEVETIDL